MVKQKLSTRASWLETKWKPILDCFETSKLRRGKTMEKQGQVACLQILDGRVHAEIRGPKMRAETYVYTVSFPSPDWKESHFGWMANLLFRHPDYLSALFADEWNEEFWNAVIQSGIQWFPDESGVDAWLSGYECNCNDPYMPCFHLAAAVYALLHGVEGRPLSALLSVGISEEALLDEVHRIGFKWVVETGRSDEQQAESSEEPVEVAAEVEKMQATEMWPQEKVVYQNPGDVPTSEHVRHRIPPNWDDAKRAAIRENYLVWK